MVVQATKTNQTISSWSLSWSKYWSGMTMITFSYTFLDTCGCHQKISRHLLCFLAILLVLMGSQWFNGRSLCHCIPHPPIPAGSRGTSDYLRSSGMTVVGSAATSESPTIGWKATDSRMGEVLHQQEHRGSWEMVTNFFKSNQEIFKTSLTKNKIDWSRRCQPSMQKCISHIYSCSKTLQKSAGKIFTPTWKWRLCRWNMILETWSFPKVAHVPCHMSILFCPPKKLKANHNSNIAKILIALFAKTLTCSSSPIWIASFFTCTLDPPSSQRSFWAKSFFKCSGATNPQGPSDWPKSNSTKRPKVMTLRTTPALKEDLKLEFWIYVVWKIPPRHLHSEKTPKNTNTVYWKSSNHLGTQLDL